MFHLSVYQLMLLKKIPDTLESQSNPRIPFVALRTIWSKMKFRKPNTIYYFDFRKTFIVFFIICRDYLTVKHQIHKFTCNAQPACLLFKEHAKTRHDQILIKWRTSLAYFQLGLLTMSWYTAWYSIVRRKNIMRTLLFTVEIFAGCNYKQMNTERLVMHLW